MIAEDWQTTTYILNIMQDKLSSHNMLYSLTSTQTMESSDNIHPEALTSLADGVKKACSIVAPTMGPAGTNIVLQSKLNPGHLLTNDGATIIQSIQLADPIESIGLGFIKEAVERSNNNSGDGSTTTCVLLNAILQEGLRSGVSTLEVKKSLDECLPLIEQSIDEQTRQITVDDIPAVAEIAGESKELANTLGEIYKVIGKDGIIHLEGSGTFDTSYSLIEGVRFGGTGYLSPYLVHDEEATKAGRKETKAVYHNPSILVTKRKIAHLNDINPLLSALQAQNKKDLVIFTNDMDSGVASVLIEAHKSKLLNILIIKAPVLWGNYVFEDFAKITGSTIVEDASGITFKNLQLDHLGSCGTIIVDKEETTVIGIKDISDHIAELQAENTNDSKLRLSWLTTKTAILKLGAKSETELSYLRLKAEDAIHSSRLALKGGVVAGGGMCLLYAAHRMPATVGGTILREVLGQPYKQIIRNMGLERATWGDEIVDAALVVKNAIRNALGIASTILTATSCITLPPEKELPAKQFPF